MRFWKNKPIHDNPKLSMLVVSYTAQEPRRLYSLLSTLNCFRAQTHENWEAIVIHDGPMNPDHRAAVDALGEPRIKLLCSENRGGNFGHPNRARGIHLCAGDFIGMSNDDNFYAPVYFEWMISACQNKNVELAFCDMIHSHLEWRMFKTKPKKFKIDCGAWIATAPLVKRTSWTDMSFDGDGTYFEMLVHNARGRITKIDRVLFMHN